MSPRKRPNPRYRRRIFGIGLLATGLLYGAGAPIYNDRIEQDLERRVPEELSEAGFGGVIASFSGQDGTLTCSSPLPDPEATLQAAYDVWGVRALELDRTCRVNRAPSVADNTGSDDATLDSSQSGASSDTATSNGAPADSFATVGDAISTDPQFALLNMLVAEAGLASGLVDPAASPVTMFAPTDSAFDGLPPDVLAQMRSDPQLLAAVLNRHIVAGRLLSGDLVSGEVTNRVGNPLAVVADGSTVTVDGALITQPDITTGNGVVHAIDHVLIPTELGLPANQSASSVAAQLSEGILTLEGIVASEVDRAALIAAATSGGLAPSNVTDLLQVDSATGLAAPTLSSLATLVAAMPTNLFSGESGFDGVSLYVRGVYATDAGRVAVEAAAVSLGATMSLEPRPEASASDASTLEADLNSFVTANPILFEPGADVLTPSAIAIIDQVAARALAFAGIAVTVEGHTDTDGDPVANVALSQARADTVRNALIERGLDGGTLVAVGFGSEQRVIVDGVEDKEASRRVAFRVEATA